MVIRSVQNVQSWFSVLQWAKKFCFFIFSSFPLDFRIIFIDVRTITCAHTMSLSRAVSDCYHHYHYYIYCVLFLACSYTCIYFFSRLSPFMTREITRSYASMLGDDVFYGISIYDYSKWNYSPKNRVIFFAYLNWIEWWWKIRAD